MDEIISQVTTGISSGIKVDVMTVLTALVSVLLIICGGRLLYEIITQAGQNKEEGKGKGCVSEDVAISDGPI